jgi:hypothetical protein
MHFFDPTMFEVLRGALLNAQRLVGYHAVSTGKEVTDDSKGRSPFILRVSSLKLLDSEDEGTFIFS